MAELEIRESENELWNELIEKTKQLYDACKNGNLSEVTALIDEGADVNWHNTVENGQTPLIAAAKAGHLDVVKLLIERDAVINAVDDQEKTAQQWAKDCKHNEVFIHLFEQEMTKVENSTKIDYAQNVKGFKYTGTDIFDLLKQGVPPPPPDPESSSESDESSEEEEDESPPPPPPPPPPLQEPDEEVATEDAVDGVDAASQHTDQSDDDINRFTYKWYPQIRERVIHALKDVVPLLESDEYEETCCSCCLTQCCCCCDARLPSFSALGRSMKYVPSRREFLYSRQVEQEEEDEEDEDEDAIITNLLLTPELEKARNTGFVLWKRLLFPSLPIFLVLLWVIFQLIITITGFIYSTVNVALSENRVFKIVALALSILNLILAFFDILLFLFTFKTAIKHLKKKVTASENTQEQISLANHSLASKALLEDPPKGCCANWKESLNQWLELIRNVASEFLLYPLLVIDLFTFISGGEFLQSAEDRVSLGYFVIGLFFVFLSVYIARIVTMGFVLRNLNHVPHNFTGIGHDSTQVMSKFMYHILLQLLLHFMCIFAVGAKIAQENLTRSTGAVYVSPSLWVVMFTGWFIPLVGTLMFFPVNYFLFEQFSIGMYINLVSLLTEKSVAEAVFIEVKTDEIKNHTKQFLEELNMKRVKKQFKARSSIKFLDQFLYPLRTTVFYIVAPAYFIMLVAFIGGLCWTVEDNGISFSLFDGGNAGIAIIICILVLILANVQFLALLLSGAILLIPTILIAIVSMVYSILHHCTGYDEKDIRDEENQQEKTVVEDTVHLEHLNNQIFKHLQMSPGQK